MRTPILLFLTLTALGPVALGQHEEHGNAYSGPEEGLGRVHMDTSCSPAVAAEFNRALALLHNFWYVRALERFTQVAKNDPHETVLLYGLSILGAIPEGTKGFEQQEQAAKLFETSMPTNRTIRVCCTTSFTPTMIPSTHSRV